MNIVLTRILALIKISKTAGKCSNGRETTKYRYRVVFLTGPTQKSSKYGTGPPQQEKMTKYTGPTQDLLTQKNSKYGTGTPQQDIEYL